MSRIRLASTLLASTLLLPLPTLASDCAHGRGIDLALDLAGARDVRFVVGPHDVEVRATDGSGGRVEGRACASSASALEGLQVTQARRGDTLVVTLERGGNWTLFGNRYARLDVTATLPRGLPVGVEVGSGDAHVAGVASLDADVGSGDLQARDIVGAVAVSVGSGDVELEGIGELHVGSIGSGDLSATRVRGGVTVGSIGSGDFGLYGAGGDVEVGSIGSGDAGLRNIAGDVTIRSIGSGDVQATGVRGDLVVRSIGSGGVDHRGVGGRVDLPSGH